MPNDYLEKIDINKSVIYVFVKMKHIFLQVLSFFLNFVKNITMRIICEGIDDIVEVRLPASKSISNRVLTINALAGNDGLPVNVSDCDDTRVMIEWLSVRRQVGGENADNQVVGNSNEPQVIDVGAAGTAMRFSTALLAVSQGECVITGSERMRQRPVAVLVDALNKLGADITYAGCVGFPPLRIRGNTSMEGGALSLRGDVSSQYVSALLMIGPRMKNGLTLTLTGDIISRPYIDMTLAVMRDFGAVAEWQGDNVIRVEPGDYRPRQFTVESDWSAASYWYEIVALSDGQPCVFLPDLYIESLQGDSAVADIFEELGVETQFLCAADDRFTVRLSKSDEVTDFFEYDLSGQPDLAQTVAVTCCMMGIPFHLTGLSTLRIKETDRLSALQTELGKLGFAIEVRGDSELSWDGNRKAIDEERLETVAIDTYKDHRMAMAFAPCALRLPFLNMNNPEVVSKSYPTYWESLERAGFKLNR